MTPSTAGLRIVRRPLAHPDAVALVAEVQAEYVQLYGTPDESPIDVAEFDEGRGSFVVAYVGDVPVATGAWRWVETPAPVRERFGEGLTVELKRMYVRPAHRRGGVARAILTLLEADAAAVGARFVVLETGTPQVAAVGLYEDAGFVHVPGFGHYCGSQLARSYAKELRRP